ncbi:hypothetical protein BRADI_4g31233v3 [Brachypodium distachyon]|uniref:Uncharacterized protein n=1 Tax=Brachypodium distachyon TaxID=15368 RepID=A0A2K2CRL8_BRADI|nr:hypothetical protein BRADI_4g31233v3 [Brachypodium distachyon]
MLPRRARARPAKGRRGHDRGDAGGEVASKGRRREGEAEGSGAAAEAGDEDEGATRAKRAATGRRRTERGRRRGGEPPAEGQSGISRGPSRSPAQDDFLALSPKNGIGVLFKGPAEDAPRRESKGREIGKRKKNCFSGRLNLGVGRNGTRFQIPNDVEVLGSTLGWTKVCLWDGCSILSPNITAQCQNHPNT